ncbi:DarT ssDNA thymidine ADP-ribosyltransferase family protein [Candidatus Poriferisodalis sp.]|uniref:DarT ssDNA thymidine ADP-ribosyltransferase family protein n=1 Tax=Candidatus Poriferisodalis sp. TaxID=3101277 RepID=UPI003AF47858
MSGSEWAPEDRPQTASEVQQAACFPAVVDEALDRDIADIVHFTRYSGLVGILTTMDVKGRSYLSAEELVEFVYQPNAADRSRDASWHDYINLSVTGINTRLFRKASEEWHPNEDWVILSFEPKVLGDPGVVFTTTNNAYPNVHRATGLRGFRQMFAASVPWGYYGDVHHRHGHASAVPTDPQAEVLYPHSLALDGLQTVIVPDDDVGDRVHAALSLGPLSPSIRCDPGAFR